MSLIALDDAAVLAVGQDAVWKITLSTGVSTGTAWKLTVAENPDHARDVRLPEFMLAEKEYDTAGWSAVFSVTTTDPLLHAPASGVVAMVIAAAQAALLTGSGPGRYALDVWREDGGSAAPVYGPVWLTVLPPARRPV